MNEEFLNEADAPMEDVSSGGDTDDMASLYAKLGLKGSPDATAEDGDDETANDDDAHEGGSGPTDEEDDEPLDLDAEEAEEDGELTAELSLDATLAKHPELQARWDQELAGVKKMVERAKAQVAAATPLAEWAQALAERETALDAYREMGRRLAHLHGIEFDTSGPTSDAEGDDDYESQGFDSPGELRAYRRARKEAAEEMDRKLAQIAPLIQEHRGKQKDAERVAQEAKHDAVIEKAYPKIVSRLKAEDDGWAPTVDQVKAAIKAARGVEALKDLPPHKVVQRMLSDERLAHARSRKGPQSRTHAMVEGKSKPPAGDVPKHVRGSAAYILAQLGVRD